MKFRLDTFGAHLQHERMTHIEKFQSIVTALGGLHPAALALGVPYPTVKNWCRRGVPARQVFTVAAKLGDLGHPVGPQELLGE